MSIYYEYEYIHVNRIFMSFYIITSLDTYVSYIVNICVGVCVCIHQFLSQEFIKINAI